MKHFNLNGFMTWLITVIVGGAILWISVDYSNDQRDSAILRQYEGSVKACVRGNVVRAAVRANSFVIAEFLGAAIKARDAAAKTATTAAERKLNADAAETYRRLIQSIQPIPRVDCAKAYIRP